MFINGRKLFADWREASGTRHRESLAIARAAIICEHVQRNQKMPKTQRFGISIDQLESDGRICRKCGNTTRRAGTCSVCPNCGKSTGCS